MGLIFSFKYTKYDFENNKILSEIFKNERIKDISFEELLSFQNHSNRSVLTLKIFSYIILADVGVLLIIVTIFCIISKVKKMSTFDEGYKYSLAFIVIFCLITFAPITNLVLYVYTMKIRFYLDIEGHDELAEGLSELLKCSYDNYVYSFLINGGYFVLLILLIIRGCLEKENNNLQI